MKLGVNEGHTAGREVKERDGLGGLGFLRSSVVLKAP